jgi:hypothetical protein
MACLYRPRSTIRVLELSSCNYPRPIVVASPEVTFIMMVSYSQKENFYHDGRHVPHSWNRAHKVNFCHVALICTTFFKISRDPTCSVVPWRYCSTPTPCAVCLPRLRLRRIKQKRNLRTCLLTLDKQVYAGICGTVVYLFINVQNNLTYFTAVSAHWRDFFFKTRQHACSCCQYWLL